MPDRGRSRLFHAIVVAGSSLVAACGSNKPVVHDAAVDHQAADAGRDRDAASVAFEVSPIDVGGGQCIYVTDDAGVCTCTFPDSGAVYPCYV